MNVTILGCGPAGMFAAHAAIQEGYDVEILSKPRKSFMRGAQYLHQPIPGLSGDPFKIDYQLRGDTDGYRNKVYGPNSDVQVSPETLVGVHDAWDIREAYDAAWEMYKHLVTPWSASEDLIPESPDLVFSTIPATLLCNDSSHLFDQEMIFSTSSAPKSLGDRDNVVLCSGSENDPWYRAARIHGWETVEFSFRAIVEHPAGHLFGDNKVHEVVKPIMTTCDCFGGVVRSGRYGKWTKGVLSHESYNDMKEALQ